LKKPFGGIVLGLISLAYRGPETHAALGLMGSVRCSFERPTTRTGNAAFGSTTPLTGLGNALFNWKMALLRISKFIWTSFYVLDGCASEVQTTLCDFLQLCQPDSERASVQLDLWHRARRR
ncbi:hypothetical protein B0H14DRAFT_2986846, partial [Mycena olivaceomarginata]